MDLRIAKLKKSSGFKLVTSNGFRCRSHSFILFFTPIDEDPGILKIGFTASKRLGGAVKRNRCKRLMRLLAAEVLKNNISIPTMCVMIAKPQLLITPYHQLKNDVLSCAKRFMISIKNAPYTSKTA